MSIISVRACVPWSDSDGMTACIRPLSISRCPFLHLSLHLHVTCFSHFLGTLCCRTRYMMNHLPSSRFQSPSRNVERSLSTNTGGRTAQAQPDGVNHAARYATISSLLRPRPRAGQAHKHSAPPPSTGKEKKERIMAMSAIE